MVGIVDPGAVVQAVAAGVSRLIVGDLTGAQREAQLDELPALYAEVTDVRHPFAPLGDRPLCSRAELREHVARAGTPTTGVRATAFAPADAVVHRTADPEVVIFEFRYAGVAGGRTFSFPCIFVVRVRDGEIVESRDYSDHLGSARAFGHLDELLARLASTP